jgi:hypothetical protein
MWFDIFLGVTLAGIVLEALDEVRYRYLRKRDNGEG